jgi:hypothetical protein
MVWFLFSTPIYALIIWYCVWSWRHLRTQQPFFAQLVTSRRVILWFAVGWLVLSYGLYGFVAVSCSNGCDDPTIDWITLVPFLPIYTGFRLVALLQSLGVPEVMFIYVIVLFVGGVAAAPFFLFLISFIEWGILRLHSCRPIAG